MNDNKRTIKEVMHLLSIGKTTLYNYMRELDIKPEKRGGRSYLSTKQVDKLKDHAGRRPPNDQATTTERPPSEKTNKSKEKGRIETLLSEQVRELKKELSESRAETQRLSIELGRWEGVAKTLKEQNIQLLEKEKSIEAVVIRKESANSLGERIRRFFVG